MAFGYTRLKHPWTVDPECWKHDMEAQSIVIWLIYWQNVYSKTTYCAVTQCLYFKSHQWSLHQVNLQQRHWYVHCFHLYWHETESLQSSYLVVFQSSQSQSKLLVKVTVATHGVAATPKTFTKRFVSSTFSETTQMQMFVVIPSTKKILNLDF